MSVHPDRLIKVFLSYLVIIPLFVFFIFNSPVLAQNLLQNPGFEEQLLVGWTPSSGLEIGINVTLSSYTKHNGQYSCEIIHHKTGSYGAQQIITGIVEGNKYLGKGYVFFNSDNAKSARIRVAWYSSEDGSGSQLKTVDSNIIETKSYLWQELDTGAIEAPATARSAEFRILLASFGEGDATVDFDDLSLSFEEVVPTPTLIPSEVPTHTPAPASSPTPTRGPTSTPTSKPTTPTPLPTATSGLIVGSFSSPQTVGEEFSINATLSNFETNKEYYLKARIGLTESELNKGETHNDSWYSDTSSWTSFPKAMTDALGNYSGSIKARLKSEQASGNYKLRVRVRKIDEDKTYDSSTYDITFNAAALPTSTPNPTATPTPTRIPTSAPTPTAKPLTPSPTTKLSPTSSSTPAVLGKEATGAGLYLLGEATAAATPTLTLEQNGEKRNLFPLVFIGLGGILILGSVFSFWYYKGYD